jgi:acetoin utilization deacetylase AcuC-like enzyme
VSAVLALGATLDVDDHDTGAAHPERADRVAAVLRGIDEAGLGDGIVRVEGRQATLTELGRVHHPDYLLALAELAEAGGGDIDPDTLVSAGSWRTASWAAGTVLAAVEALERGEADAAFVATRPPGHHATATRAMGFCLLDNVAVAAAALAEQGERVLIVDWDAHHGNGTQDIFWDDPRVLVASFHQWPTYPGSGGAWEVGGPAARGLTLNVPLPAGATGDVALAALDEVITPAAEAFDPTWVLVSAGYDGHRDDPLVDLALSAGDFADLASRVGALAPRPGRLVAVLEGGYALDALARSAGATAAALAGLPYRPEPSTCGGPGRDAVAEARRTRNRLLGVDP